MELKREQLEKLANPTMLESTYAYKNCFVAELAKHLLAEMDKPKVWEHAKDDDVLAVVSYAKHEQGRPIVTANYYRTIPKSPEREIAERVAYKHGIVPGSREQLELIALDAINEYKESVK